MKTKKNECNYLLRCLSFKSVLLIVVTCVVLHSVLANEEQLGPDVSRFKEKLESLAKARGNQAQILLGVGELYSVGGRPLEQGRIEAQDYCKRVLQVSPRNLPATLKILRFRVSDYLNKLGNIQTKLLFAAAVRSGKEEFPTNSVAYEFAQGSASNRQEVALLWSKMAKKDAQHLAAERQDLMKSLARANGQDATNSVYDYLQVAMLAKEKSFDSATLKLREAVNKAGFEDYAAEGLQCRSLVLESLGMPWAEEADFLTAVADPLASFLRSYVFNPMLQYAEKLEKEDARKAAMVYALLFRMGEQALASRHNAMDLYSSLTIKKIAIEHQARLYGAAGEMAQEEAASNMAAGIGAEMDRVMSVYTKRRPLNGSSEAQQKQYREFLEKLVKQGEWRALEECAVP